VPVPTSDDYQSMPHDQTPSLTADELLAADRLLLDLLAERTNTVDLASTVAPRVDDRDLDAPAAATG